jgi:L,D-peptidoglycan transpeptidase YkuD (ErfK/YbiS/YcfS/YnhG family)
MKPTIKNKGSAIFIHISKRNYRATSGCIALNKLNLIELLENINTKTKIKINC